MQNVMEDEREKPIIRNLEGSQSQAFPMKKIIILLLPFLVLGVLTGYAVASFQGSSNISDTTNISKDKIDKGDTFGSTDTKTFRDQAEGLLREGGIDGEGAYHLERPGGVSQNVYITSSVIDLSLFVGKKVKVWGETNAAKRAGWLMDVGRVEILQ